MDTLYMGFAQADITPETPVETIGFGRSDEWSRGVLSPLCAQLTLWRHADTTCCLIAIDHIGFSRAHAAALRAAVGAALGVRAEQVMLCFSHTHSAPNDSLAEAWFNGVCAKLMRCLEAAKADLAPVYIAWGNGRTSIGVNRRMEDALDDRLGVLDICRPDGTRKALLLRLTAHCNVLKADNYLISADYFGAVREALCARYACPVILTQGASGNVAPRFFRSELDPPDAQGACFVRREDALEAMAAQVLADIAPVLANSRPAPATELAMYSQTLTMLSDVPTQAQAEQVAADAKKYCYIEGSGWLKEAARLRAAGVTMQETPIELQYFKVGRGALCGVSEEILCEFALRALQKRNDPYFYLGGYTNGCTGYFPTEAEFDKGGFEVYWSLLLFYMYYGHLYPFHRESAQELIDFAVRCAP